jgi:hypothetical protein
MCPQEPEAEPSNEGVEISPYHYTRFPPATQFSFILYLCISIQTISKDCINCIRNNMSLLHIPAIPGFRLY